MPRMIGHGADDPARKRPVPEPRALRPAAAIAGRGDYAGAFLGSRPIR